MRGGDGDEGGEGEDLHDDERRVEGRAFAHAEDQQSGDHADDTDGGQVHQARRVRAEGAVGQVGGQAPAHAVEEARKVAGPADGDGGDDERVFEDQAPADDPGEAFAEGGVAVGVGAAGGGDHRREFGIGERREDADAARDQEGQHHRRAGLRGAHADQRVDAGADNGADAEGDEVRPAERGSQPRAGLEVRDRVDRPAARKE